MFYWKPKTEKQTTLSEEMLSCDNIKSVQIATAFISSEGVTVLRKIKEKHNLPKDKITLYLSEQFSSNKPGNLLRELLDLCGVKIIFEERFHPKIFLFRGSIPKLIYGSSNFTKGGLSRNIEFTCIKTPSKEDLTKVEGFFSYCDYRATAVNLDVVEFYKERQADFEELKATQKKLKQKLSGYMRQDDEFALDTYDLSESFFSFEDYETFFLRNVEKTDPQISARRSGVQNKMIEIHQLIYPAIQKLGVAHHKCEKNITSLIRPCQYNKNRVPWIGVRYGKLPSEVDAWNFCKTDEDAKYGFQKHGCLQFSVNSSGFDINLFLAVKNGAIDRMKLSDDGHRILFERRTEIEMAIKKLIGNQLEWHIENETPAFRFDEEPTESFCDWFKDHDQEGYESYLMKYYAPDDPVLKTKQSIAAEVIRVMTLLRPLYNAMVWRPPVT